MKLLPFFLFLGLLAGCGAPETRITAPPVAVDGSVRIGFASVELREVSLPTYAAGEEIFVETGAGVLESAGSLWADDPARAVTLDLSRALADLTGRRVAPEPWPYDSFAAARLDVRIETMLAGADGMFRLAGQYFVAGEDGSDRSGLFDLAVQMAPESGVRGVAAARAQAIADLAREIALKGLR